MERANQYLETSFIPGRSFTGPADFNTQLTAWLPLANSRIVRRTAARPDQLVVVDRAAMLSLPPIAPSVGFAARVRLPRDYYVRVAGNDYSVDPAVIGRMVAVRADLAVVTITCDGRTVGIHDRHPATGQTITDPVHVATARRLREELASPRPAVVDDLARDLRDYDTAFGVVANTQGQVA
ncbi:MAG: hypothetical protein HHJ11_18345 [Phycicoccus sp.]|nr:hypothetical protein [Phycicoccus sp.]